MFSYQYLKCRRINFIKTIDMFQIDFAVFIHLISKPNYKVHSLIKIILINLLLVFAFQRLNVAVKLGFLTSLNLATNRSRLRMTWSTEPLGYSVGMRVLRLNFCDILSVWLVSNSARRAYFANHNGILCVFWLVSHLVQNMI